MTSFPSWFPKKTTNLVSADQLMLADSEDGDNVKVIWVDKFITQWQTFRKVTFVVTSDFAAWEVINLATWAWSISWTCTRTVWSSWDITTLWVSANDFQASPTLNIELNRTWTLKWTDVIWNSATTFHFTRAIPTWEYFIIRNWAESWGWALWSTTIDWTLDVTWDTTLKTTTVDGDLTIENWGIILPWGTISNVASNKLIINQESDFPTQDATTITLADNVVVEIGSSFSTSKRVILGKNPTILGQNGWPLPWNVWTYTGTWDMFTWVDSWLIRIDNLAVSCPNASQIWNVSDTPWSPVTEFVVFSMFWYVSNQLLPVCEKFGTFTDIAVFNVRNMNFFTSTSWIGLNDGISIAGTTVGIVTIQEVLFGSATSATYIWLDLWTTVITNFCTLENFINVWLTAGSIWLSWLANNGNLTAWLQGRVLSNAYIWVITPLNNISSSNVQWEILNSPPVANSSKTADAFLTAQETVTIGTIGVFVPINWTNWASDVSERFTVSTAWLITYNWLTATKIQVIITSTVSKVWWWSDEINLAIAINGTEQTKTISGTENSTPTSVTALWVFTVNPTDTIQAFVANQWSTSNIIVDKAVISVINGF